MNTLPPVLPQRRAHLWLALYLGLAAIVANLLLQPYQMTIMAHAYARAPLPLWQIVAIQALQSGVLCFVLGWLGLVMGARHGLGAPWLQAWVEHRRPALRGHWLIAMALGVVGAVIIVMILRAEPGLTPKHADSVATGMAWRGALASFYGGIVEETLCRLFLVSLFVWLLAFVHHRHAMPWMFVIAIIVAALLFGAGHLPAALAAGMHPSAMLLVRVIGLNAIAGFFFGGIYWKYGLEHAMVAHFSADLVLHVLVPMLAG